MNFNKSLVFLYAIFIIVLTWPIFAAWIPALAKPWWWYPFGVVVAIMIAQDYFSTRQFVWLIIYTLVILLNSLAGDKYIYDPIVGLTLALSLFILTSAPYVILKPGYYKTQNFLYETIVCLLIFTSIASYIINIRFPGVVRNDITITGSNEIYEYSYLYRFGLTRYQFAHAIPILIPPLIMAFKEKAKTASKKVFFALLALLCIVHTFVSGSTTAFFLSLIALVMSLAVKAGSTKVNVERILILSILLLPLLNNDILSSVLGAIDYLIGGEGVIHEHILDLQESLMMESITGDVAARQHFYNISWRSFFSNPLIGTNENMGNHSVILDHLGAFGLIGFIPFICLLMSSYKYIMSKIGNECKYYYVICMICAFGMLMSKNANIWVHFCFLFIVAPIFYLQLSKDNNLK